MNEGYQYDPGRGCHCCHYRTKYIGAAWCDYCFTALCMDSKHTCKSEADPGISAGAGDSLDSMVRDFCKVGPLPKSEVRRRIEAYASSRLAETERALREIRQIIATDESAPLPGKLWQIDQVSWAALRLPEGEKA